MRATYVEIAHFYCFINSGMNNEKRNPGVYSYENLSRAALSF